VTGRFQRTWVAGFVALLAVFGFGQLESWPFTSWYMFSGVEPHVIHVARAVAVGSTGDERVLSSDALPAGLLSQRLLARFSGAAPAERTRLCDELLRAARALAPAREVRVEQIAWRVLDRTPDGRRPASVGVTVVEECR